MYSMYKIFSMVLQYYSMYSMIRSTWYLVPSKEVMIGHRFGHQSGQDESA